VRSIQARFAVLGVVALAAVVAAPASASDVAKTPKVTITGSNINDYAFSPATVHVKKGGKVKWSWNSNAPHNVTFKKLGEASDDATKGSYSLKFKKAGTYKYECTIHDFKGKVVVK
jgi:plastocyanin